MKWKHNEWTIRDFLKKYDNNEIDLAPSYQRNPIWTANAQKLLIDTILTPQPLPNFFIRVQAPNKFEMVDGQQRARTIIAFRNGDITSSGKIKFDDLAGDKKQFLDYPLNVTEIIFLEKEEVIEDYYALVNNSGLRLNTPELRKAEYYETRYLRLASRLAASSAFSGLNLFTKGTIKRMNDVELVIELLALILEGISEQKKKVDALFESDISLEQEKAAEEGFNNVIDILSYLDSIVPLNKTRYKQRADLYTVFEFIHAHNEISRDTFKYYYRVLIAIEKGISPSQKNCDRLRDYARNCVSQSNSFDARRDRSKFLRELLRHNSSTPNAIQKNIITFLKLSSNLVEHEGAWTLTLPEAE